MVQIFVESLSIPEDNVKNLGAEEARLIAQGILNWLTNKGVERPFKIGIGHDSRLTGPELKTAMIEVFKAAGCKVLDFGLATTPALFMATQLNLPCDARKKRESSDGEPSAILFQWYQNLQSSQRCKKK